MRSRILVLLLGGMVVWAQTQPKQPFTTETMLKLSRISEPALSPDGTQVAFTVQTIDVPNNAKPTQIYVVPLAGGTPHQLTREGSTNGRPRWSPDSKTIFFV